MRLGEGFQAVARGCLAGVAAHLHGGPGLEFDLFGRKAGLRLAARGRRAAVRLLLNPVSLTRYWEFPFVARHMPVDLQRCLDVGSPRLLSAWAVASRRARRVVMINPDARDVATTVDLVDALGLEGVEVRTEALEDHRPSAAYECIWSVSVVEHIAGDDADGAAVGRMMDMLRPGGRLILTLPVDRSFRIDVRREDTYGLGRRDAAEHFFQRVYDEAAVRSRIVAGAGVEPISIEWFGERVAGTFAAYEGRWIRRGMAETSSDARLVQRDYQAFGSWAEMPGHGVVGLVFVRPGGKP